MSLHHDPRCRACVSPRRVEIDRRLTSGESARGVSRWLKTQKEDISKTSLSNHLRKHLAVMESVRERVAEAEVLREEVVGKAVARIELLDDVADIALNILRPMQEHMVRDYEKPKSKGATQTEVMLFTGCLRELREAVKTKHEILNGKKVDVDGLDGLAGLLGLALEDERKSGGEEAPPPLEK